jgi:hypothetical protein
MRRVVDGNVAREFLAAASGGEPSTTTLSGPLPDALQEGSDEA